MKFSLIYGSHLSSFLGLSCLTGYKFPSPNLSYTAMHKGILTNLAKLSLLNDVHLCRTFLPDNEIK